ncbi:hypothetical protein BCR34DRAFT_608374 [Clohesyomyces aquaticus]|uniref:Uncharacterized protein n=1 Tax=Clohesyomyces aquaticus TaxID=1231657 RepID=A0A1Y1Y8P2_9PLEO|nr:hypothetical protein BCR34DRAFT_608374 [Clohesyomyces aquaticus]
MGDEQHLHRIVVIGATGQWSIAVVPEQFQHYSRSLYELIEDDIRGNQDETHIQLPKYLSCDTLVILITSINIRKPCVPPLDFDGLLRLSTSIWKYACSPRLFSRVAEARQDEIRPRDGLGKEAAGWTFIALVFGWERSFRSASRELVVEFGSSIEAIDGTLGYFPGVLRARVVKARLDLVKHTFDFIKENIEEYETTHALACGHIRGKLLLAGIDISLAEIPNAVTRGEDGNIDQENPRYRRPREMLDHLEVILLDTPVKGGRMEILPSSTRSSLTSASGRETSLSMNSSKGVRARSHRSPSSSSQVSIRGSISNFFAKRNSSDAQKRLIRCWETQDVESFEEVALDLRDRIARFEAENFCGLDISQFQRMRQGRLLLTPLSQQQLEA